MPTDPLGWFERLVDRATDEALPPGDVTAGVLATLASRPARSPAERDYWVAGAGSALAAGVAALAGWLAAGDDLLFALAQPFLTVPP